MAIQVMTPEGAVHLYGTDVEAAYEITGDSTLRIVVFEPGSGGLQHARTAAVYADGEWIDVRSDGPPLHPGRSRLDGHGRIILRPAAYAPEKVRTRAVPSRLQGMEPHVSFVADRFITDAPDGDGALPGRDLTQWLLDELRSRGVDADGTPGQEDFGWYARYRVGAPHLLVVSLLPGDEQEPARWAGWFERDAGVLGSLAGRRRGAREDAACVVRELLESSPLVSDLRWTLPRP